MQWQVTMKHHLAHEIVTMISLVITVLKYMVERGSIQHATTQVQKIYMLHMYATYM